MSKNTILGLFTSLLLLAFSGVALADLPGGTYDQGTLDPNDLLTGSPGQALPPGASEQEVFQWDGEEWVSLGVGGAAVGARSWNSGPAGGFCNKAYWDITFTSHASVAQWLNWTLATTRKDWRVRKPGVYASNSIDATLASNNDVVISFDGFGDLAYLPDQGTPPPGTETTIETWYGVGPDIGTVEATGWVPASDLNNMVIVIDNSLGLHSGFQYKIWQKIQVEPSNNSSEYENVGTVRVGITNLKFWVDGSTGNYAQDQTGSPPATPWVPPLI